MLLPLTGVLAFAHVNNYSTLDATRDIVVVELDRLYYYWTRCAGGYALIMTSTLDLTTEQEKPDG